jgi:hypothetical protein
MSDLIDKLDKNNVRYSKLGANIETLKYKLMAYERALQPDLCNGWVNMKAILDSKRPVIFEIPDVSREFAYAFVVSKLLKIYLYRKDSYYG